MKNHKNYVISDNLEINIFPSKKRLKTQFNFGSSSGLDEWGFVISNIFNSLKIIIEEKSEKIKPHKSEYKIWWLILVDRIGNGLEKKEFEQLRLKIDFDFVLIMCLLYQVFAKVWEENYKPVLMVFPLDTILSSIKH